MVPTPPTTTAGLLSLLQSGESITSPYAGSYWFHGFWNAFGGQIMDEDGHCIANQGGVTPAMQYILSLQNTGALLDIDYEEATSKFENGVVGMLINGPWVLNRLETALGSDLGVVPLPSGPAGPAKPMSDPEGFFINPNTANPANVVDLALYMTNQASSQIFTDVAKHIPARTDVTSSDPLVNAFIQAFSQGAPRPKLPQLSNYWNPFNNMVSNVLAGFETPQVGVQNACNEMDALNFHLDVRANNEQVEGYGWPMGASVTLKVNNPVTSANPDYSTTRTVTELTSWDPNQTYISIDLWDVFDIKPGYSVSLSDGVVTKTHTVKTLAFTDINLVNDTVTGIAAANSNVDIWACNGGPCPNRSGVWVADFAHVGVEVDEQDLIDLAPRTWIDSSQPDTDYDNTMFGENVPNPNFNVRAYNDQLELNEWPLNSMVNVEVDDPGTAPNPDYTTSAICSRTLLSA
jgi:hypothetical protein